MTLDFYFLRRFLFSFLVMFGVIVLFVTLIDLVEQMRRSASIPLSEIMRDVALQLPINLSLFFNEKTQFEDNELVISASELKNSAAFL